MFPVRASTSTKMTRLPLINFNRYTCAAGSYSGPRYCIPRILGTMIASISGRRFIFPATISCRASSCSPRRASNGMAVSNAIADNAIKTEFRNNMPTRYPHRIEPKMNGASRPLFHKILHIAYFTISKVNDIFAPMLNSPGEIGVDFSNASIVRMTIGLEA